MKVEEKILLYWSGEADEALAREVEELLEAEPEARRYFDELSELTAHLQEEAPARREGLLDEVLVEAGEEKVISLPSRGKQGWWLGIAAALAAAVGLVVMTRTQPETLVVVDKKVEKNLPEKKESKPRLSERLLKDSRSFRERGSGLAETRRDLSRWQKMRPKDLSI